MTKITRLTLEQGGLERQRLHLREISDDTEAPLETVGQDLRTARQRKGEDLAAISRVLRIRKDHLEALEEGNIHALPGRPYALGFLRSYAEYLGLDPVQCVERFKAEIAGRDDGAAALPQMSMQDERRLPQGSLILLVLLVIAVVYGGYYLSVSANRMLAQPVTPVPDRFATEASAGKPSPASPAKPEAQAPSSSAASNAATSPSTQPGLAAVPPAQMPAADANAAPSETVSGHVYGAHEHNVRVELRVHNTTKVLVEGPDNSVYINQTLHAGDIFRAPNMVGLVLTTPDGGAVEIVLDGTSMGLAGKPGKTAEGLSLDPQAIADRHGA